jgi:SAM-dependent methyltransferase
MKLFDKKTQTRKPIVRDRYRLYEIAVQSPEHDVPFIDAVYKKKNGKIPRLLREDFCGTAFLSAHWVRKRPDNRAIAVDHDLAILEWGRAHNLRSLGNAATRLKLVQADVRAVRDPKADVVTALNYSYFVFKERRHLFDYFRNIRRALDPAGVFVLDIFGGWETQMEVKDATAHDGFTYYWEQSEFDPLTHRTRFHIHFELDGGEMMKNAFTYDWRMWSIPEVKDALSEAGFDGIEVYWEGIDPETGEGDGVFRTIKKAKSSPGWNALIVAS